MISHALPAPVPDLGTPAGLDTSEATAVVTINAHSNTRSLYRCRGVVWPCERGRLAEHTLAALS
ncbi:hypothetical protein [Amycolatopsis sp. YIM 10]|uniref:hypothetical protein n=1 Tax=Amycolatopsis sp. YIM 10 TaxID=2653857 RepID=UPI00128FE4BE|nr:hypothetical protein [Amycolatopsis sp. YIM 10]QFU86676.1 hypothetical protein YIM_07325 [Amycolatopsis sp. YIM 10]